MAAAGLRTVEDLLFSVPLRYEDRRRVARVAEINAPGAWTVAGRIEDLRAIRTRRRGLVIVRARLVDETGSIPVSWFNQPYLVTRLQAGGLWLLHGTMKGVDWGLWEMTNPTCEVIDTEHPERSGRIVPIYSRVAGMPSGLFGRLLEQALPALETAAAAELLPPELLKRYALPELSTALRLLHRPAAESDVDALNRAESAAHSRLAYGELLEFQL